MTLGFSLDFKYLLSLGRDKEPGFVAREVTLLRGRYN